MNPLGRRALHHRLEGANVARDPIRIKRFLESMERESNDSSRGSIDETLCLGQVDCHANLFPNAKMLDLLESAVLDKLFNLLDKRRLACLV